MNEGLESRGLGSGGWNCVDFQIYGHFFTLMSLYLSLPHVSQGEIFVVLAGIRQKFLFGTGFGLLYYISPIEVGVSFGMKTHQNYL